SACWRASGPVKTRTSQLPSSSNFSTRQSPGVSRSSKTAAGSVSLIATTCADGELVFEYRNELSDLPLQVDTALDPRDTAVETVEPNPHRGDVSFDGGQSHDHFVELAFDAVEPSVNAAQVNQPGIFRFVVLWGILVISHDRVRRSRGGQGRGPVPNTTPASPRS